MDQCAAVELKDITGCSAGHVCDPYGACVKPQCASSADCTSADAPICIGQLCVPKCTVDADCTGRTGTPYCASDGVCVACNEDSQCSPDKPVCDVDAHACRFCERDRECPDDVCLESVGTCAAAANVIFVRADGSDTGTCTPTSPCATLPYAFGKLSTSRNVVHVLGGVLDIPTPPVTLAAATYFLDGENTRLRVQGTTAVLASGNSQPNVIVSHLILGDPSAQVTGLAMTSGQVELYGVEVPTKMTLTGGQLEITHSNLDFTGLDVFTGGSLNLHDSNVATDIHATDVTVTLERNRYDLPLSGGAINAGGNAVVKIENNVIISSDYLADAVYNGGLSGSTVRFNTFVNLSGVNMGGQPLDCGANVDASSNIIAWHSSATSQCAMKYTLFDALAGLRPGEGNHVGDASTFFVDMQLKDFHLAPGSPAKGIGQPGTNVTQDIEGNPRPSPSGSSPDVGAYEAP